MSAQPELLTDPLLSVDEVHVNYGAIPALRGVSLVVHPGEMVALLGANGAGKTTTLRAISGLIHPHAGTITFNGERIDGQSPPQVVRRGVAHLPEGRDLFPGLSVKDNLRYGAWPVRRDRRGTAERLERVYTAFPKLSERARQKAGTLSGGEQQMLAVGMALMSNPQLLVIDELSLGLAPMVVTTLFDTLAAVNALGTAILLVEQFVPLALKNTHRAYVLGKGQVQLADDSRRLADDPSVLAAYLGESAPADTEPPKPRGSRRDRAVAASAPAAPSSEEARS